MCNVEKKTRLTCTLHKSFVDTVQPIARAFTVQPTYNNRNATEMKRFHFTDFS